VQPVVHRGLQPRRSQPCLMHGTSDQRREIASLAPFAAPDVYFGAPPGLLVGSFASVFRSLKCLSAQDLQFGPRTGPKAQNQRLCGQFLPPPFICI